MSESKKFVLAIDQGTTGSKAVLLNEYAQIVASHTEAFKNYFPKDGWVEHEIKEIFASVRQAVLSVLSTSKVDAKNIASIGITNQRETTVLWDAESHQAVDRAIVWQCLRTQSMCQDLTQKGLEKQIAATTGLTINPYFSGTKMRWLLDKHDPNRTKSKTGQYFLANIDTSLLYWLSGYKQIKTDVTNASRTLLMNINTLAWDEAMSDILRVPLAALPQIVSSDHLMGQTLGLDFLPNGIPINAIMGDQQSALFGHLAWEEGLAKCTYGTGAFMLVNTGKKAVVSQNGLLTTVAWQKNNQTTYAVEGSTFIAGALTQWLRDNLNLFAQSKEIEVLAAQVPDSEGVLFLPALAGLGAPYWRADILGEISGLTRKTNKHHICRAAIEGIALQIGDLVRACEKDFQNSIRELRVDGGATTNNILMQFQANLLNTPILVSDYASEITALGAGYLSGLSSGLWDEKKLLNLVKNSTHNYVPNQEAAYARQKYKEWQTRISGLLKMPTSAHQ